ncbi:MAG: LptF/LptG family permease [Candidatus Pelagibacter sp. TMED106]|nr:MAG: LptF/LptG family permease [Candidatus Pelagibacter sp. TMED106]|tara:strand:- start:523 stop:1668 length:1146 start_codon:yes stop_codon:yes gene_type:complete
MLKNKIYKYFTLEIGKSFLTILFAFTAIAWTVRAVNFLDLIVEDGFMVTTYLYYSALNIPTIITRFIPLAFLLAIILSILKFDRQNEFVILWTSGLNKMKIVNLFFLISLFVTVTQIFLAVFIIPDTLNKSRSLLRSSDIKTISSIVKSKDFSDTFKYITFYVDEKKENGEMKNIFIRDEMSSLSTLIAETKGNSNTTIIAKKGNTLNGKLILHDGMIQSQDKAGNIKNVNFTKTELAIDNLTTRTIITPKIQETSTKVLFNCLFDKRTFLKEIRNCPETNYKQQVVENVSRRIGMPFYIPLVSLIASFLLTSRKNKKGIFFSKYIYFIFGFIILILAEILVRFSGFSSFNTLSYFLFPFLMVLLLYFTLMKTFSNEKVTS